VSTIGAGADPHKRLQAGQELPARLRILYGFVVRCR
jgi:hypothetical protein